MKFPPEISRDIGRFFLKSREVGRFFREFWLFSRENPTKSADFSANFDFFPGKIQEIACFSRENPAKLADFSANFPLKIPRNFAFFFREISEALFIVPYEFFCILSNWLTRKSFFEPITVDYLHFINNFSAVMYKRVVFLSLFEGFLFFKLITSFFYHCI